MKLTTKSYLVLTFIVLLALSCGPVTPVATREILPTRTVAPTYTNTPVPSLTATLSPVQKIFVLPTRHSAGDTPTPIATPEINAFVMKLRTLPEEDALDLVYQMNEYSYRNFPSMDDWWTDGNFIASQKPVALAIQEYLYRYPESASADRLRWQLAFINSIEYSRWLGNSYGDAWILSELEKSLNQGDASPDQLETILDQYWFDVAYYQPIENLFNDGQTGWLYEIAPQAWEEDEIADITQNTNSYSSHGGLFVVVRQIDEKKVQLFPLSSAWSFSFAESSVFDVTDHNQNGIPEIALYIGYHSGTMCNGDLLIYEWHKDAFVELTNKKISLGECGENFEYSNTDGIPSIIFSGGFPRRTELYLWNGSSYEFARYPDATPLEVWRNSVLSGTNLPYRDEAKLLSGILASNELKYPALSDFLRYRLGTLYAFDSKSTEAVREFQNLISAPADPTRTIFTDMAKIFLEKYKSDASLYDACYQSRLIYDDAFETTRDAPDGDEKYEEIFGFPFDPFSLVGYLPCADDEAFRVGASLIPTTVNNIPAELRKMGVDINYSRRLDVNLDGNAEEWFVMFGDHGPFLVFFDGSHYQAASLGMSIEDDNYSSLQIEVEAWDKFQDPIMIIQTGREFELLEIDENYESKSLFYDFAVADDLISNQDDIPQLQIFYSIPKPDTHYPDHPWSGYRWDAVENKFKDDLIEYNLFIAHDPEKAVEITEQAVPYLEEWKNTADIDVWSLPYTYYLFGLSYELAGDQQKAAQIYWQLWHDFPDSHYALMARHKLKPVHP